LGKTHRPQADRERVLALSHLKRKVHDEEKREGNEKAGKGGGSKGEIFSVGITRDGYRHDERGGTRIQQDLSHTHTKRDKEGEGLGGKKKVKATTRIKWEAERPDFHVLNILYLRSVLSEKEKEREGRECEKGPGADNRRTDCPCLVLKDPSTGRKGTVY